MKGQPFGYTEERDKKFHNRAFELRKEKTFDIVLKTLCSEDTSKKIRILDVGCGNAPISVNFIGGQREIYGIDISFPGLIDASHKGVVVIRGDLAKAFPFSDNVFDCVLATEIIEHVFDTDKFLSEMKRVLKPEGVLVLSTPNLVSLRSRLGTLIGRLPAHVEYRTTEGNAGHIRGYNITAIRSQLEEHNFEIIELTTSCMTIPLIHIFIKKLPSFLISFGDIIVLKAKNKK